MKLPRDVKGAELVAALARLGYYPTRQSGSHIRLTATSPREHHLTVPAHDPVKVGTLSAIIRDIADVRGMDRQEVMRVLF